MAQSATGAVGPIDPDVIVSIDGVSDERVVVASALVRFEATIAKSDAVQDGDTSAEWSQKDNG